MKILEVLDCYYPKFDGPTLVITSYCKSFIKSKDVNVSVCVPKFPKYVDDQPFKVVRIKSINGPEGYRVGVPKLDCKLKKFLKNEKVGLIHIHSPFTLGKYFVNYGKKNKIPTVFTFHTKYKEDFQRTLKCKFLQNFMMKYIMKTINKADYILTVSNGAALVLKEYGCNKQIEVIRNGTDLIYPDNAEEMIEKVNQTYNLKNEKNVFLSVGRIVENKNLDLALQAISLVKQKGHDFKYIIVGDGPYLNKLKASVEKMGLKENVVLAGKIMDRSLLSAFYLRSDLFIFPSTFDTASLAPIEAAALKLPSLMTLGCSTAEIITDKINGFLAKENPNDWAECICEIITDKEKLKTIKENAYSQVYRTWDNVADEVYDKYQEIISHYNNKQKQG